MKIEKIHIKKFRGFKDVSFNLGVNLTAIAGQNGTQKTTVLGILTQTFSIMDKLNPMYNEKPLSGGNFKSAFSEKFKLSETFDKAKDHEWTLHLDELDSPYTIQSIHRDKKEKTIRFWKKGDKSEGSGYLPLPVIYLSLKRLIPIGEDSDLNEGMINLNGDEINFCNKYHKKILLIQDTFNDVSYLESKSKNTIGVNTPDYDWKQNSAGQDNIGKILLAILSFKRLQKKYPEDYKGGILAIDELEATLFPASQEELVKFLSEFAGLLDIQIFFTTHSLDVLRQINSKNKNSKNKYIFLRKIDGLIEPLTDPTFEDIVEILNVTSNLKQKLQKIPIYCEDEEARIFTKQLLGISITKYLLFNKLNLGCQSYVNLVKQKIPSFEFPKCIILLDGDFKNIPDKYVHILSLPGNLSPEKLIADYLNSLSDRDSLWTNIGTNYNKQLCFRNYPFDDILEKRELAKQWFTEQHKKYWGKNANKVINPWIKKNKKQVSEFRKDFIKQFNILAKKLELNQIKEK